MNPDDVDDGRAQRGAQRFVLPFQLATALLTVAIIMGGAVGLTMFG
ncbi:MAG: hypothetical protein H7269_09815 [Cellulomonas sp.]|nr:hypothetical protein [Cellulomonas sp.]